MLRLAFPRQFASAASSAELTILTTEEKNKQASNVIISALGDHAFRATRSVVYQPHQMFEKLDARYNSKKAPARFAKTYKLVSLKYMSVLEDMAKHVD